MKSIENEIMYEKFVPNVKKMENIIILISELCKFTNNYIDKNSEHYSIYSNKTFKNH